MWPMRDPFKEPAVGVRDRARERDDAKAGACLTDVNLGDECTCLLDKEEGKEALEYKIKEDKEKHIHVLQT